MEERADPTVHNIHHEPMLEGDVYIGRAGHGKDGYFGNPYSSGTRAENISDYRNYLIRRQATDPEFRARLKELRGKRLFCFCKPQPCHGDAIVEWLRGAT